MDVAHLEFISPISDRSHRQDISKVMGNFTEN